MRQIHEVYGESGQVRLEFKQYAFLSDSSKLAAEASLCANDQGQFWPYHDMLFANRGSFSQSSLEAFAKELGLDTDLFNQCLAGGEHRQAVQDQIAEGAAKGVTSTPTIFINDYDLVGAQPFENLQTLIDQALGELATE